MAAKVHIIDGNPFVLGKYLAEKSGRPARKLHWSQAHGTAENYRWHGYLARVKKDKDGYFVLKSRTKQRRAEPWRGCKR